MTQQVARNVWGLNSFLSGNSTKEKVIANRDISEDLEHLHHQAVAVLPSVSINSETILRQKHEAALHMKSKAFSRKLDYEDLAAEDDEANGPVALRAAASTKLSASKKVVDGAALTSLLSLCDEVVAQRALLPNESSHTSVFDDQWGIETTMVNVSESRKNPIPSSRPMYRVTDQARAAIYDDIVTSDEEARELNENIQLYTVQHGGLAILNLFLLDLLGRTTVAAKIFKNKFEEDFEQTRAVSRWFQAFAVFILIGCNGFFIYYSLLKAFQQGKTWQYKYIQGCIVQILVETFLNETLECLWLNYVVPDLVRKEVKKATVVINKVVEQITAASNNAKGRSILFLDAPSYLFSSTKVARAHPTLLESIVVLNYQTHLPGELSRMWPHSKNHMIMSQRSADRLALESQSVWSRTYFAIPTAILAISTTVVLMMQWLGTMSFNFQRVVIRFVQPLLLSGLTLMWLFASTNPIGLIITIVGTVVLLGAFAWRQYYVYKIEARLSHSIAPGDADILNVDIELEDIESVPNSKPSTPTRASLTSAGMTESRPASHPVPDADGGKEPDAADLAPSNVPLKFFDDSSDEEQLTPQPLAPIPFVINTGDTPFNFFVDSDDDEAQRASTKTEPRERQQHETPQKTNKEKALAFFDSDSDDEFLRSTAAQSAHLVPIEKKMQSQPAPPPQVVASEKRFTFFDDTDDSDGAESQGGASVPVPAAAPASSSGFSFFDSDDPDLLPDSHPAPHSQILPMLVRTNSEGTPPPRFTFFDSSSDSDVGTGPVKVPTRASPAARAVAINASPKAMMIPGIQSQQGPVSTQQLAIFDSSSEDMELSNNVSRNSVPHQKSASTQQQLAIFDSSSDDFDLSSEDSHSGPMDKATRK